MNLTWPGRRIYGFGRGKGMRPGDYGRCQLGLWWVAAPIDHLLPVTVPKQMVEEHDDQSITVKAEIKVNGRAGKPSFKGRLIRGEWRNEK